MQPNVLRRPVRVLQRRRVLSSTVLQIIVYYNCYFSLVWGVLGIFTLRYKYLASTNFRNQIINPFMYAVWAASEMLRLYLGWAGNVKEEVRYLFGYLVMCIMPQVITNVYNSRLIRPLLPIDVIMSVFEFLFLAAGFLVGWATIVSIINDRTARFAMDFGQNDVEGGAPPLQHQHFQTVRNDLGRAEDYSHTNPRGFPSSNGAGAAGADATTRTLHAPVTHHQAISEGFAHTGPGPSLTLQRDDAPATAAPATLFSPDSRSAALARGGTGGGGGGHHRPRSSLHRGGTRTSVEMSGLGATGSRGSGTFTFSRDSGAGSGGDGRYSPVPYTGAKPSVEQVIANVLARSNRDAASLAAAGANTSMTGGGDGYSTPPRRTSSRTGPLSGSSQAPLDATARSTMSGGGGGGDPSSGSARGTPRRLESGQPPLHPRRPEHTREDYHSDDDTGSVAGGGGSARLPPNPTPPPPASAAAGARPSSAGSASGGVQADGDVDI